MVTKKTLPKKAPLKKAPVKKPPVSRTKKPAAAAPIVIDVSSATKSASSMFI